MTSENVQTVFATKIIGDIINLPNGSFVDVESFVILFADAPSDPTYNDLVEIDGGNLGYIPFFDQCKDDGLLS